MAKYYYNGVLLPEIPADVLAEYPYCWIRNDGANSNYNLVFASTPWYYNGANLTKGNTYYSIPYYSIPFSGYENAETWGSAAYSSNEFGLASNRTVLWANHDIPNGSATSTTIYFYGSDPVPGKSTYVKNGMAEFAITPAPRISNVAESKITWNEDIPENTILKVFARLSGGDYTECLNGGAIPCISAGDDLTGSALEIKVEMSTEDTSVTPSLSDLEIVIRGAGDDCVIVLSLTPGNITSIQNAIGEVAISYGGGTLSGQGGPVADFALSFTPEGLEPKHHPHSTEHIATDVSVSATLARIRCTDASATEHIEVAVNPVAALISVDDI